MKTLYRLPAVLLASLLSLAAVARGDFTFIHASDVHVGAGNNKDIDAAMFQEISKLSPQPAFVVATGDICENGTDAQYAQYRECVKSLGDVKMHTTTGNHDVRWNPRGKEGYTKGTGQPLYQSWDYQNVHFVALDSTVLLEHWGHIAREELDWLKADLEKVGPDKPVIIGFHHWIGRETVQVDNEQALLDLVKPYNVVLWLQGHGHSDIEWSVNGVPAIMVAGLYQGSYNVIDVTNDELKITKRFGPKPMKKGELLQNGAAAPENVEPAHRNVMTIPLKKQPMAKWSADAKVAGGQIELTASAPADATLEYRVDMDKPQPLAGSARIPTTQLVPGEHTITVQAGFPNKRAYQVPLSIKLPGAVAPIWEVNVAGEVQSRLIKSGDTLLVSSMGNDLVALNAADGSEKFRSKTAGPIFSACCVDNGVAYFGSADHNVYAIDAATGAPRWKTPTGGAVLAGPAAAQGIVCIGSTDTKIYGLDAARGSVAWTVPGMNMFQSQAATDGTHFFVGGWDNHFRCIEAKSGQVKWDLVLGRKTAAKNFSPFAPAITSPAVGQGQVYVSTNDGILHALRIEDGFEAWQIDKKKMGYSSPLYHDGRVYCGLSDEGKVYCVDAASGMIKWTAETGSVIYDSSFCFGGGNVFIGCVSGVLSAINADSGKIAWQYRLGPGHLLGSPVADDKQVYMGSMSGKVIALPVRATQPTASR